MERFPEPVSGQVIPRGWFARLVRFVNSLRVRGDGQNITVKDTEDGQVVTVTPALLQKLGSAGSPGSGAPQDISAAVSGGTLTLALSGSTSAVRIVGADAASITQDPVTGDVTLSVSGGGSSIPDWTAAPAASFTLDRILSPSQWFVADATGILFVYSNFVSGAAYPEQVDVNVIINGTTFTIYSLSTDGHDFSMGHGSAYNMPILSGSTVTGQIVATSGPGESPSFTGSAIFKFYT